jgi:hypothetical protein
LLSILVVKAHGKVYFYFQMTEDIPGDHMMRDFLSDLGKKEENSVSPRLPSLAKHPLDVRWQSIPSTHFQVLLLFLAGWR